MTICQVINSELLVLAGTETILENNHNRISRTKSPDTGSSSLTPQEKTLSRFTFPSLSISSLSFLTITINSIQTPEVLIDFFLQKSLKNEKNVIKEKIRLSLLVKHFDDTV